MTAATAVTATFTLQSFALSVTHAGTGTGEDARAGLQLAREQRGSGLRARAQLAGPGFDTGAREPVEVLAEGRARVVGQERDTDPRRAQLSDRAGGARYRLRAPPDHAVEIATDDRLRGGQSRSSPSTSAGSAR